MIKIKKYTTVEECISVFHNCEISEIYTKGPWIWEQDGVRTVWGMKRMIRCRKKEGTWGFCEDKGNIHVWIGDNAKPASIIRLLGHELGHRQRPFKRDRFLEERKAEKYADVALKAFEIMQDLIGDKND